MTGVSGRVGGVGSVLAAVGSGSTRAAARRGAGASDGRVGGGTSRTGPPGGLTTLAFTAAGAEGLSGCVEPGGAIALLPSRAGDPPRLTVGAGEGCSTAGAESAADGLKPEASVGPWPLGVPGADGGGTTDWAGSSGTGGRDTAPADRAEFGARGSRAR